MGMEIQILVVCSNLFLLRMYVKEIKVYTVKCTAW